MFKKSKLPLEFGSGCGCLARSVARLAEGVAAAVSPAVVAVGCGLWLCVWGSSPVAVAAAAAAAGSGFGSCGCRSSRSSAQWFWISFKSL